MLADKDRIFTKFYGFTAVVLMISMFLTQQAIALEPCKSVADRDCAVQNPLIIAHGISVSIKSLSKQKFVYPLKQYKAQIEAKGNITVEDYAPYCPDGKCICEEDIGFFRLKGSESGLESINDLEHKDAASQRCSIDNASVSRHPEYIYAAPPFVSVVSYAVPYCRGCGGGCHGSPTLATYNTSTGKPYTLKDAVDVKNFPALRDALLNGFMDRYANKSFSNFGDKEALQLQHVKESIAKQLAQEDLTKDGIYVENGILYANAGGFALSCAEGSFHPVAIPENLMTPVFLALLKQNQKQ